MIERSIVAAQEHSEQGLALSSAQSSLSLFTDSGVGSCGFMAKTLQLLGYPDQAQQRSTQTMRVAQELSSPTMLAFAHYVAAMVHSCNRDVEAVKAQAEAQILLCREHGFPFWEDWGTMFEGWALAHQGHPTAGIVQIKHGLQRFQDMGSGAFLSTCYALLTEAYAQGGQAEEGLNALAEALERVAKTGERLYEAELHRLKGELTLRRSKVGSHRSKVEEEAETCFHKAIEIAQKQEAKSFELRAATSLARLWQQQGKTAEARELLAPVYNWFREGFDTADLKDAKALLAEWI